MTAFTQFRDAVNERFTAMSEGELFVVDVAGDDLWETYLAAFPEGTNPMFRERTEHDCSCCKNFIRNIANVVAIEQSYGYVSAFSNLDVPYPYDIVARAIAQRISNAEITGVYRTSEFRYGTSSSNELRDDGTVHQWDHFHTAIDAKHRSQAPDSIAGIANTKRAVLQRGLNTLTDEALTTVAELIASNSLYRGEEHSLALDGFTLLKAKYNALEMDFEREQFCWLNASNRYAGFRNTVIGTLVQDLSEGVGLDSAVKSFESKVAPANYKRSSALITPRMIAAATQKIEELGLTNAVDRRFATIEDVSVNNVLWVNSNIAPKMRDSLTDLLMEEVKPPAKTVGQPVSISIDDFLDNVAPTAEAIDLLVENKHLGNFMSITAPLADTFGTTNLFKWDNNFAWSYDGDVADGIKQRVKAQGGNVDAKLRISLAWFNGDDLDINCTAPGYGRISYQRPRGILDVDMNAGGIDNKIDPIENLQWVHTPADGNYLVRVHNYSKRSSTNVGFELEVECGGKTWNYVHDAALADRKEVNCLSITIKDGAVKSIDMGCNALSESTASKQHWGVSTQSIVPVQTIMHSPNYWDDNETGNRHTFFILKDCLNPEGTRGFYNEFLNDALHEHRKVLEVLGAKTKCEPSDTQLSGVGFSSTSGEVATVVVSNGTRKTTYEIAI